MVQLKSINHLKNILPAGITLHAKDNFPMSERSCCLVHLWRDLKDNSNDKRSRLRSSDMLACISAVSMMIPKNERRVEGPSIFDDFTGVLIYPQRESMVSRLLEHSSESGDPAVKKSSK